MATLQKEAIHLLPKWHTQQDGELVEFILGVKEIILILIPKNRGHSSACRISANEMIRCLENLRLTQDWIQSSQSGANNGLSEPIQFRMLGDPSLSESLRPLLLNLGLQAGEKSFVSVLPRTQIHFIPKEARVRIPKELLISSARTPESKQKTKVLIVDDSELMQKLLRRIIDSDPQLTCVGCVGLPSQVFAAIEKYRPDVITLDIHMPEISGVELLKLILARFKVACLMISAISKEEGNEVLDSLALGAVDYIQKPSLKEIDTVGATLCEKIKVAANSHSFSTGGHKNNQNSATIRLSSDDIDFSSLIVIGSSTGGTEALKVILTTLPIDIPPILIVQHIPSVFSKAFADRMNQLCPFEVKEAEHNDLVGKNRVFVAPGGKQMKLSRVNSELRILIDDSPPVNRCKPSVDTLFESVAALKIKNVAAAILTGMGADGAQGLLKLKLAGAHTVAQNEATCVVYGMPREAVEIGAVEKQVPIEEVAPTLIKFLKK